MHKRLLAAAAAATALAGLGAGAPAFAQPPLPGGSYLQTCRNVEAGGGRLSAECLDTHGHWQRSTLPLGPCRGPISNENGMLFCNAVAGGPPPPPPPQAYGGPPPAFGDQRYGDPRFDPRYAEGGWGFGHRPGEWVAIRDRAGWLDMRIDRAQREGRIDGDEARDLRGELHRIEDMEARMVRDGRFGPGERADLDHRFDDLSARVRFDAGPPDRDGFRDRR
jgi:hypothetical protein